MRHLQSVILVSTQFTLLIIILATTAFRVMTVFGWLLLALAGLILVWSLRVMMRSTLRVFPEPAAHATLVKSGPYQYIRHPMYTGVLTGTSGLVAGYFSWPRLVILLFLIVVLLIKLRYEERLLVAKFPEYTHYRQSTWFLIPFMY